MGNRRFAQVSTSDEEETEVKPQRRTRSSSRAEVKDTKSKKKIRLPDEEEEEVGNEDKPNRKGAKVMNRRSKKESEEEEDDEEEDEEEEDEDEEEEEEEKEEDEEEEEDEYEEEQEEEEQPQEDAKPIGEPVRLSGKGRGRRRHYNSFEYDGNHYELEDPVLLVPEDKQQKPYAAIIKDITQANDGTMMVTGQWFYRPEEAEKKGGGSWQSRDTRELFYSFHRDEVPAESVMHKCLVHFVPIHKQLPNRKQHPGFIVQKVYDTVERKLWKLTDKDYEDNKQHEIDLLVQKTISRLGELPDVEIEETVLEQEDQKAKKLLRKRTIPPLDVTREEDGNMKLETSKPETPGSCTSSGSKYAILVKFDVLTGQTQRDRWLERLLHAVQYICDTSDSGNDEEDKSDSKMNSSKANESEGVANEFPEKISKSDKNFRWPDAAVPAVSALERASHEVFSADFQKYNAKLRQLEFNLKNNKLLAQRLLNGELEPSKILNMTPTELKVGLTAEETARKEPEKSEHIQMTDAICSRCGDKKVGVRDMIQAGHGTRYQLECYSCGHSWYSSRDDVSILTDPSTMKSGGTAFDEVEKLVNPRDPDKGSDSFNKTSEPYTPVSDSRDPPAS